MLIDDERRTFMRLSAEIDVKITRMSSGEVIVAKLSDLSTSGCGFYTDMPIQEGEELEVAVSPPNEDLDVLRRYGRAVRILQTEQGRLIGLEFVDSDS